MSALKRRLHVPLATQTCASTKRPWTASLIALFLAGKGLAAKEGTDVETGPRILVIKLHVGFRFQAE